MSQVLKNQMSELQKDFPNTVKIVSPRGKVYNVSGVGYPLCDLFCDCRGFLFRGECSHVDKVRKENEARRNLRKDSGITNS
jgi:hypothetical protein